MQKNEIGKIRVDVISEDISALYMLLDNEGMISRQGTGQLPADEFSVTSESDGSVFKQLIEVLDDRVFEHAGVYDHPDKQGIPVTVSVAFLDGQDNAEFFEFRFGTKNEDVGELLPFFDKYISHAIQLTDYWYYQEKEKHLDKSDSGS
ncbi:MAG: hypothetical protein HUJ29_03210 [Gammaproteobacteria bacterium]|nr:hypothetical protein [Gammaproteobacteria bacterium]